MIHLNQVSKRYGETFAVKDVQLDVRKGERLVLLGTSGSGKTTLLRMINRLVEPSSGSVDIEGLAYAEENASLFRRHFGYVIQNHGLFPHFTVSENIAVIPRLLGWGRDKIRERINELMYKFQLDYKNLKDAYPAELSGGQKQRVGLARALAGHAPVLLMDEPFGALDRVTRISIRNELLRNDELYEKTVIMVTHDVEEAIADGDRICLMDKGCIQQVATPQELLFHPRNDFTRHFFDFNRTELEWKAVPLRMVSDELTALLPRLRETLQDWMIKDESMWQALSCFLNQGNQEGLALLNDVFSRFKNKSG